ncbi:PREDICTED: mediator of RNA polymerase II transcription subunit 15a-like isoform X2 [Populus euphratica]|uniref:Mediator of RNA polymerase II transcription subunit 15a-like isoform X2 n=1 Tax=Populus euphratica TaxID=75702 RepID=A0AAJ6TFA7_POPEU|nr:PREDICTED: mediator of RNA polymerase II transcription subunit 15a-like isoform X2 [Populus euphratica]
MKETLFPEMNEMYQRIAAKVQQHDSHLQQPKSEQLEKLEVFKAMLERLIAFLQVSKIKITTNFKEKLCSNEKHIVGFLNPGRFRKLIPNLQLGQLPQPPVPQLQSHENQLNTQLLCQACSMVLFHLYLGFLCHNQS